MEIVQSLYIIDYWVPDIEGIIILIAQSDAEAFEVLSREDALEINDQTMPNIIQAQKLILKDEYEPSILQALITDLKND